MKKWLTSFFKNQRCANYNRNRGTPHRLSNSENVKKTLTNEGAAPMLMQRS